MFDLVEVPFFFPPSSHFSQQRAQEPQRGGNKPRLINIDKKGERGRKRLLVRSARAVSRRIPRCDAVTHAGSRPRLVWLSGLPSISLGLPTRSGGHRQLRAPEQFSPKKKEETCLRSPDN